MVAAEAENIARDAEAAAIVTTYTCSTGIVLNVRAVPPRVRSEAIAQVPRPKVPTFFNKNTDREEENPDHPDYAQALLDWNAETTLKSFQVSLVLGTTVGSVPEGKFHPEDDGWIDEIETAAEVAGAESKVRRTPEKARYCDWLLYHALGNEEDHYALTTILYSMSLVTEAGLANAIETFRRLTRRPVTAEGGDTAAG